MAEQLFIVTGASRGLGLAIAEQLLEPGHVLLCISRKTNDALASRASAARVALEQWSQDLAQPVAVATRLGDWLRELDPRSFETATLINNAGVVTNPGPADEADPTALSTAIRVGLEAPLLLAAGFLRVTAGWPAVRRVLNISSGLGRRAMAGSAAYCAAKAGMDHFSRAMAMEGAMIVSLAPGVIDTDMQVQLRAADPAKFPDHHRFVGFKTGGQLASPAQAAASVLAYLRRADFGSNPVADVRDA
jgi:benzil reductase ((S)-benzoin forming)